MDNKEIEILLNAVKTAASCLSESECQKDTAAYNFHLREMRDTKDPFEVLLMCIETAAKNAAESAHGDSGMSHEFNLGVLNGLRLAAGLMGIDAEIIKKAEKAGIGNQLFENRQTEENE